jgi:hypothetical protein
MNEICNSKIDGWFVKRTACPEDIVQFPQAPYDGLRSSKSKYYTTCAHKDS